MHDWEEGVCKVCKDACAHDEFQDIYLENGNHKAENGVWESKGDDGHWCLSIEYWEKCVNCGMEQKYVKDDPYHGEIQDHMLNNVIKTYYQYDENEHWVVGEDRRCTARGCAYVAYVVADESQREEHQYMEGECACGAKEANNNNSSSDNGAIGNNGIGGQVDDNKANGALPGHTIDVEKLPYHFGDYQLAEQVQRNNDSNGLVSVASAITNGVYENIETIFVSNVNKQNYDKNLYRKALLEILQNVPSDKYNTERVAEFISGADYLTGTAKDILSFIERGTSSSVVNKINGFVGKLNKIAGLSEVAKDSLVLQYKGRIEYFESLKSTIYPPNESTNPLYNAIDELQREYEDLVLAEIKNSVMYGVKEGVNDLIDKGKEGVGKVSVSAGNVLFMLEIADFAMKNISKATGLEAFAEGSMDLVTLQAVEALTAMAYLDAVYVAKKNPKDLTDEQYSRIVATYDLMRGCLITINKSAAKVDDRPHIVEQLEKEIKLLEEMSIDKWRQNEYYREDFFKITPLDDSTDDYFRKIVGGGEYTDQGFAKAYHLMNTEQKDIVNREKDKLNTYAKSFATRKEDDIFYIRIIESEEGPSLVIENEDGGLLITTASGTFMGAGSQFDCPSITVLNQKTVEALSSNQELKVSGMALASGMVSEGIDEKINRVYYSWMVNKKAVETILRKYADELQNEHGQYGNPTKFRKGIVYALLKTILESNWWDTYDGLMKQGVAEQYRP